MPGKQHEIWFHEKLLNKGDTNDFRVNRAEDWTKMQVLDGNTFKPAMGQGFSGMPSSEQMENLYKLAEQGKLVYFAHGEKIPFAVLGAMPSPSEMYVGTQNSTTTEENSVKITIYI